MSLPRRWLGRRARARCQPTLRAQLATGVCLHPSHELAVQSPKGEAQYATMPLPSARKPIGRCAETPCNADRHTSLARGTETPGQTVREPDHEGMNLRQLCLRAGAPRGPKVRRNMPRYLRASKCLTVATTTRPDLLRPEPLAPTAAPCNQTRDMRCMNGAVGKETGGARRPPAVS